LKYKQANKQTASIKKANLNCNYIAVLVTALADAPLVFSHAVDGYQSLKIRSKGLANVTCQNIKSVAARLID